MTEVAQNELVEPTPQVETDDDHQDSEPLEGSTDEPSEDDQAAEEDTPKPAGRREKRISQLTFEKYELERQKNAEIEALRKQLEEKASQAQAPAEGKPTRAQFDYDEDSYFEALADWKADQKVKTYAATQAQQAQSVQQQAAVTAWNSKRASYATEHPEYTDMLSQRGSAVTSNAVASYLTSSDIGPKLHHELLENFEQLQRIQSLPEWQQGAELAKLESKISQVKPKQKSNAPTPVRPVGSSSSTPAKAGVVLPTDW